MTLPHKYIDTIQMVKSVNHLPLDFTTLKHLQTNHDVMAYCARCLEQVLSSLTLSPIP
jgi:deoxyribose-phosphate aldolase